MDYDCHTFAVSNLLSFNITRLCIEYEFFKYASQMTKSLFSRVALAKLKRQIKCFAYHDIEWKKLFISPYGCSGGWLFYLSSQILCYHTNHMRVILSGYDQHLLFIVAFRNILILCEFNNIGPF